MELRRYHYIVSQIHQAVGSVSHQVDHLVPPQSSQGLRGLAGGGGSERVGLGGAHGGEGRGNLSSGSHDRDRV